MSEPFLVCRFGAIGDMVVITPALKLIHKHTGQAPHIFVSGGWCKELYHGYPHAKKIIQLAERKRIRIFSKAQKVAVNELAKTSYPHSVIFESNDKKAKELILASQKKCCIHTALPVLPNEHAGSHWLRCARAALGLSSNKAIPTEELNWELSVSEIEKEDAREWRTQCNISNNYTVVQIGNSKTMKRGAADRASNWKYWPSEKWAAVIRHIRSTGKDVILSGAPNEAESIRAVAKLLPADGIHQAFNDLPIRRLCAVLSDAAYCVSVDTGPAHIAAAVNCPLLTLFGKTNPNKDQACSTESQVKIISGLLPGYSGDHKTWSKAHDMSAITIDDVTQQIQSL